MTAGSAPATTEADEYDAFIEATLAQIVQGFKDDGPVEKRQKLAGLMENKVLHTSLSAGQRALCSRFLLGVASDGDYLQTGMAPLWSTAPRAKDGKHVGLELSPPGLYAPDAVDGIRAGLVRALKRKNVAMAHGAATDLAAFVPALRLLLSSPTLMKDVAPEAEDQKRVRALLDYNWAEATPDKQGLKDLRKELLALLNALYKRLEGADKRGGGAKAGIAQLILDAVEAQAKALQTAETKQQESDASIERLHAELDSLRVGSADAQAELERLRALVKDPNSPRTEELREEVAVLRQTLEEDEQRHQQEEQATAEANTFEKQLFDVILEEYLNDTSPLSETTRESRAQVLAEHFARLALVGQAMATINAYNVVTFLTDIALVAGATDARVEASDNSKEPLTASICKNMTEHWLSRGFFKASQGSAQYNLLCRNLVAWKLYQEDTSKKTRLLVLPRVRRDDGTFLYFVPLVDSLAKELEDQRTRRDVLERDTVMQNVGNILNSWYSLPKTTEWKRGTEGDFTYLYAEVVDSDGAQKTSYEMFKRLLAMAMGAGSMVKAGAVLGAKGAAKGVVKSQVSKVVVRQARAYFGLDEEWYVGQLAAGLDLLANNWVVEQMRRVRNGNGSLLPGLRLPGTDAINSALAFRCYTIYTEGNASVRTSDLNDVSAMATSPVRGFAFQSSALATQAATDPYAADLLAGVLKLDTDSPFLKLDNQLLYEDTPRDCVLYEVARDTMPVFATHMLAKMARFDGGLRQGIAERLHKVLFLSAMDEIAGFDVPGGLVSVTKDETCVVALVVGATVHVDAPRRTWLIANVTKNYTTDAWEAAQRTRIRSLMQHTVRGPFDNAPISLTHTLDRFVAANPLYNNVLVHMRLRVDYLVVPLEGMLNLKATKGYAPGVGSVPRLTDLLVSDSMQRLRDDPITSTLTVQELVGFVAPKATVVESLRDVSLNDLPMRVFASPAFKRIRVNDTLFEALRYEAAKKLKEKAPKEAEGIESFFDRCQETIDPLNPGAFNTCLQGQALLRYLPSAASSVARVFEASLPFFALATGLQQQGALYVAGMPDSWYLDVNNQQRNIGAATDDHELADWVVARGLVGQRGPTCAAIKASTDKDVDTADLEADKAIAMVDARLDYALPSPVALGKIMPHLKQLMDATDEPTDEEVRAVLAALPVPAPKATAAEVLALFDGNYAVVGPTAAADDDDRGGIEVPHAVRWLPTADAAGRTAARVAALEHVAARCTQLAEAVDASKGVKAALREAAATLKLAQMAPLYATHEAVAYEQHSGCCKTPTRDETATLVTQPCAMVRGTLALPLRAGVARVDSARRITGKQQLADASEAKMALKGTTHETNRIRAQARAKGLDPRVYVAPPLNKLRFQRASTAATGAPLTDPDVSEACSSDDFTVSNWRRILRRAIVATNALPVQTEEDSATDRVDGLLTGLEDEGVTPHSRRDGLWNEFRRELGISNDRLWVFVRLMSGAVGGDVNEIISMADEVTLRQSKAIQEQQMEVARTVSKMQSDLVTTIVGSMAKESKLALDKAGNQLVIIDAKAQEQMDKVLSGGSGMPFFEANVAVRNLKSKDANAPKPTLSQLLSGLTQVGHQMQASLEQTLVQPGGASASLAELSHPRNCYFVSLRPDAVAAIRIAHERMNVELGMRGGSRRLSLWETIEGGCSMLTTRFAEFAGHVLVQARSTTGISAMYVAPQAMHTNAIQARVALERLVHGAVAYAYSVAAPNLAVLEAQEADVLEARAKMLTEGSNVAEHDVGRWLTQMNAPRPRRPLRTWQHESGWGIVGARTR